MEVQLGHLALWVVLCSPRDIYRLLWQWTGGKEIHVERSFPFAVSEELVRMGHKIVVDVDPSGFGRGQIIWRNGDGVLVGATEPRADGTVAVW